MTPLPWAEVRIDPTMIPEITAQVAAHEGFNPACHMVGYWAERMTPPMLKHVRATGTLPYGFVGDGWPLRREQSWAIQHDCLGLHRMYHPADLPSRDAGDAIYQANRIRQFSGAFAPGQLGQIVLVDFGAGYGRLAFPFTCGQGMPASALVYYGVDYSPIGLLCAPQFIDAVCPKGHVHGFVSLPAWELEAVPEHSVDVFVSIHSFQEMSRPAQDFYVSFMRTRAKVGAIFYSVNLAPAEYIPSDWSLISRESYPINRDGSFFEQVWEVVA